MNTILHISISNLANIALKFPSILQKLKELDLIEHHDLTHNPISDRNVLMNDLNRSLHGNAISILLNGCNRDEIDTAITNDQENWMYDVKNPTVSLIESVVKLNDFTDIDLSEDMLEQFTSDIERFNDALEHNQYQQRTIISSPIETTNCVVIDTPIQDVNTLSVGEISSVNNSLLETKLLSLHEKESSKRGIEIIKSIATPTLLKLFNAIALTEISTIDNIADEHHHSTLEYLISKQKTLTLENMMSNGLLPDLGSKISDQVLNQLGVDKHSDEYISFMRKVNIFQQFVSQSVSKLEEHDQEFTGLNLISIMETNYDELLQFPELNHDRLVELRAAGITKISLNNIRETALKNALREFCVLSVAKDSINKKLRHDFENPDEETESTRINKFWVKKARDILSFTKNRQEEYYAQYVMYNAVQMNSMIHTKHCKLIDEHDKLTSESNNLKSKIKDLGVEITTLDEKITSGGFFKKLYYTFKQDLAKDNLSMLILKQKKLNTQLETCDRILKKLDTVNGIQRTGITMSDTIDEGFKKQTSCIFGSIRKRCNKHNVEVLDVQEDEVSCVGNETSPSRIWMSHSLHFGQKNQMKVIEWKNAETVLRPLGDYELGEDQEV